MNPNRSWMYNRAPSAKCAVNDEFLNSVEEFVTFALGNHQYLSNGDLRCPCKRCKNKKFHGDDVVRLHLYKHGFVEDYYYWISHGESFPPPVQMNYNNTEAMVGSSDNTYRNMIIEGWNNMYDQGMNPNQYESFPELDGNTFPPERVEEPNHEASEFYRMLRDAEEPLFPGCTSHTTLSFVTRLLNIKVDFNMSETCFNRIL